MTLDLTIKLDNGFFTGADTINAYYDFISAKEQKYDQAILDQGPNAENRRKYKLARIGQNDEGTTVIFEQWPSALRAQSKVFIHDLVDSNDSPIYNEDIQTFIGRLRDAKEKMKQLEDPELWEYYFELRLVALCEFALENGYGVVWN